MTRSNLGIPQSNLEMLTFLLEAGTSVFICRGEFFAVVVDDRLLFCCSLLEVRAAVMAGVNVIDSLDDSSSWHSAFDPPCTDLDEPEKVDGNRKQTRSRAPRVSLCSSSDEVERRRKKKQKKRVKKTKKSRKRRSVRRNEGASSEEDRIEDPLDAARGESLSATVLDQGDNIFDFLYTVRQGSRSVRPSASRSTACAKVLVRSGLRCPCHFLLVSQCPNGHTVRKHPDC